MKVRVERGRKRRTLLSITKDLRSQSTTTTGLRGSKGKDFMFKSREICSFASKL